MFNPLNYRQMKTLIKPLLVLCIFSLSICSCSIQDEIITEDESEIIASDPSNEDDDPEIG